MDTPRPRDTGENSAFFRAKPDKTILPESRGVVYDTNPHVAMVQLGTEMRATKKNELYGRIKKAFEKLYNLDEKSLKILQTQLEGGEYPENIFDQDLFDNNPLPFSGKDAFAVYKKIVDQLVDDRLTLFQKNKSTEWYPKQGGQERIHGFKIAEQVPEQARQYWPKLAAIMDAIADEKQLLSIYRQTKAAADQLKNTGSVNNVKFPSEIAPVFENNVMDAKTAEQLCMAVQAHLLIERKLDINT